MGYLTLVPRTEREMDAATEVGFKPRRARIISRPKMLSSIESDGEESSIDDSDYEMHQMSSVRDMPDLHSDTEDSSFGDDSFECIRVDTETRPSTRGVPKARISTSTSLSSPKSPSNHPAPLPEQNGLPQGHEVLPYNEDLSSQQSLHDLFKIFCRTFHEQTNILSRALDGDANERAQLQAQSLSQREEIVQLKQSITELSSKLEEGDHINTAREEGFRMGYNRAEVLHALIKDLQQQVAALKEKDAQNNDFINTLVHRQSQLQDQLRGKTSEAEKARAKCLRDSEEVSSYGLLESGLERASPAPSDKLATPSHEDDDINMDGLSRTSSSTSGLSAHRRAGYAHSSSKMNSPDSKMGRFCSSERTPPVNLDSLATKTTRPGTNNSSLPINEKEKDCGSIGDQVFRKRKDNSGVSVGIVSNGAKRPRTILNVSQPPTTKDPL